MARLMVMSSLALMVVGVGSLAASNPPASGDGTVVKATGQAAIMSNDVPMARDKALEDALRKAVEQAVGTMVSSETVTQNYELLSDKILSKSKGYVRSYKIATEKKGDDGVYSVEVEATVATGNLQNDVKGILQVLKAKNMPRVLVMVAEQNVGQGGSAFWWGDKTFSTNLDAVENTFIDAWSPKGFTFVDRQALAGKLSTGPALGSAEPSDEAIKTFASKTGAEVVIIGKAVATDVGPIMGTQMHSIRANISLRALNLDNGRILGTATTSQAVGHIDPTTGGTQALQKVAQKAADELLKKILDQWETEVAGPSTVSLTFSNVHKSTFLRELSTFLRSEVRGVQDVRQRSFRSKVAELEVDIKGSAQDLAEGLEQKKFPGFAVEIDEITANGVSASLK